MSKTVELWIKMLPDIKRVVINTMDDIVKDIMEGKSPKEDLEFLIDTQMDLFKTATEEIYSYCAAQNLSEEIEEFQKRGNKLTEEQKKQIELKNLLDNILKEFKEE